MAYPKYKDLGVSGPGLLYVNSKITDIELSPELFKKWYEQDHIPDIFVSGTISAAFRYRSTTPDSVERPYLALYPLKDVSALESPEFKSIRVHSDVLPGGRDGAPIFHYVDFAVRYYTHMRSNVKKTSQGK